jgi:hypothetical protein
LWRALVETRRRPGVVSLVPGNENAKEEVVMSKMTTRFATLRPAIATAMVGLAFAAALGAASAARADDEVYRTYEWRNGRQVLVERHYVTPPTYYSAPPPSVIYEPPPPRIIVPPPAITYEPAPPPPVIYQAPPPVTYVPPPPVTVITR